MPFFSRLSYHQLVDAEWNYHMQTLPQAAEQEEIQRITLCWMVPWQMWPYLLGLQYNVPYRFDQLVKAYTNERNCAPFKREKMEGLLSKCRIQNDNDEKLRNRKGCYLILLQWWMLPSMTVSYFRRHIQKKKKKKLARNVRHCISKIFSCWQSSFGVQIRAHIWLLVLLFSKGNLI